MNPIRFIRRHRRLRADVEKEVSHLSRIHGEAAYAAALEKLERLDLTHWGRLVVKRAAKKLKS